MADEKFSQFTSEATISSGDVLVGLHSGINAKFNPFSFSAPLILNNNQIEGCSSLNDSSNNAILDLFSNIDSVNYLQVFNNTTISSPGLQSVGADNDIGFYFVTKNAGVFHLETQSTSTVFTISSGTDLQHSTLFNCPNTNNGVTLAYPDISGTFALTSQLPNQAVNTGSSPTFVGLTLSSVLRGVTAINDASNNSYLGFSSSDSAVNYFEIQNGATNNYPTMSSAGTDADIGFGFFSKGIGEFVFLSESPDNVMQISSGAGYQHLTELAFASTANSVTITFPDATGTVALTSQLPSGGSPLSPSVGGTGVNNGASTFTIGGNFALSGAHTFTGTLTNNTTVTFPTSGTLATTSQIIKNGVTNFVVDKNGGAEYTTIQAAINAAHATSPSFGSPAIVWIWGATYTENLTLYPYVCLAGATDPSADGVTIVGNSVYTGTGNFSITNIAFTSNNSSAALSFQSSGAVLCHLQSVAINAGTGIGLECTSSTTRLDLSIGSFTAGAGGKCLHVTDGFLEIGSYSSTNTDTSSVISGGTVRFVSCDMTDSFDVTGGTFECLNGIIISGSTECLTIGASGTAIIVDVVCSSSAGSGFIATGSGAISYTGIVAVDSANAIDPALTDLEFLSLTGPQIITGTLAAGSASQFSVDNSGNIGGATLSTSPPSSSSSSLAIGSAYQNTLGYDAVFVIYLSLTAPLGTYTVSSGVGPTNTPTQQTIITYNMAQVIPITLYIPNNYYALLSVSVQVTGTIIGQQAMAV